MCNDTETEIADTMKNSIELMCVKEGIFSPNLLNISTGQWDANYTCQIPNVCGEPPDPDSENTGLMYSDHGKNVTIKAYRNANYSCNESSLITDEGYVIPLPCLSTGEYQERPTWPKCREPVDCLELPPVPGTRSGLGTLKNDVTVQQKLFPIIFQILKYAKKFQWKFLI